MGRNSVQYILNRSLKIVKGSAVGFDTLLPGESHGHEFSDIRFVDLGSTRFGCLLLLFRLNLSRFDFLLLFLLGLFDFRRFWLNLFFRFRLWFLRRSTGTWT
jgi:hypothetical protein